MASFNELLQNYVNLSYDELLSFARISLSNLADDFKRFFDGDDGAAKACMVIVASCLGADGKLTSLEHKFLNDLLGTNSPYESTMSLVSSFGGAQGQELTDRIADSLPQEKKSHMIMFCLCFLAVDETISRDEVAFITKLIQ